MIQERVKKGEYYFSKHGDQRYRMLILLWQRLRRLYSGRILEQHEDTGRGKAV